MAGIYTALGNNYRQTANALRQRREQREAAEEQALETPYSSTRQTAAAQPASTVQRQSYTTPYAVQRAAYNYGDNEAVQSAQEYLEEQLSQDSGAAAPSQAAAPAAAGSNRYQSQYGDRIAELVEGLLNPQAFQSHSGDRAADLLQQIMNRPGFESQYGDMMARQLDAIMNRPGYESPYAQQIENLYNELISRPKFEYNPAEDPLYAQYRDQYIRGGQQAMRDTMGNAAALTGGYGNSWANTAAYQAYQNYLQGLNGVIPQLRQQAWNEYQQEGDLMRDQLSMALGMDDRGYDRWAQAGNDMRSDLAALGDLWNRDLTAYQQQGSDMRANYNALMNQRDLDWETWLQQISNNQANLNALAGLDEEAYERYMRDLAAGLIDLTGGTGGGGINGLSGNTAVGAASGSSLGGRRGGATGAATDEAALLAALLGQQPLTPEIVEAGNPDWNEEEYKKNVKAIKAGEMKSAAERNEEWWASPEGQEMAAALNVRYPKKSDTHGGVHGILPGTEGSTGTGSRVDATTGADAGGKNDGKTGTGANDQELKDTAKQYNLVDGILKWTGTKP